MISIKLLYNPKDHRIFNELITLLIHFILNYSNPNRIIVF
jgi:hypothetical protein